MNKIDGVSIMDLDGEVIGLSGIRKINNHKNILAVSQAVFLITTSSGVERVQMFFWDSDASQVHQLALGRHYQFNTIVNRVEKKLLLFYLPKKTVFRLSSGDEFF